MRSYIQRSIFTILRIFITYKPLRFFFWVGAVPFALGFLLLVRWLVLFLFIDEDFSRTRSPERGGGSYSTYAEAPGRARTPSLILAAILILIGVQAWCMGAVADVIAVNRKLLEDIQQRVKRIEYGGGS